MSRMNFQDVWLTRPDFQPWLALVEGDFMRTFCTLCKIGIGATKSTLERHKSGRMQAAGENRAKWKVAPAAQD